MVVPLTPEDLDAAIETLTTAFCRDPMYVALIEDERARRPWVQFLMAGLVRPRGPRALWVGVDGGRRGALYATPSDHVSRIGAFAGLVAPLLRLPLEKLAVRRAMAVSRAVAKRVPRAPFLHVHVVAVSDDARGQGVGGALLRHAIEVATAEQKLVHLETTNPTNVAFYEKLGFAVLDEVRCFEGAPPLWTMQRPVGARPAPRDS